MPAAFARLSMLVMDPAGMPVIFAISAKGTPCFLSRIIVLICLVLYFVFINPPRRETPGPRSFGSKAGEKNHSEIALSLSTSQSGKFKNNLV